MLTNRFGRTIYRLRRCLQELVLKQTVHAAGTAFQWCGNASTVVSVAWRVAHSRPSLVLRLKLWDIIVFMVTRFRSYCPFGHNYNRTSHSTPDAMQLDSSLQWTLGARRHLYFTVGYRGVSTCTLRCSLLA